MNNTLTNEMQEGTHVEHLSPPQVGLRKPANQHRGEGADPHEAQVHRGCQVVAVAQLHRAEEDHVADDAEEGEPLTQLHQENTDDRLELFAGLPWFVAGVVMDGPPVPGTGGLGEPSLVLVLVLVVGTLWQPLWRVSCHHTLRLVWRAGPWSALSGLDGES